MSPGIRLPLAIGGGAVSALVLMAGCVGDPQLLDPDGAIRALALRDAKAAAQLNETQVWQDYSPCFQAANPKNAWLRDRYVGQEIKPLAAPADAQYAVVAVKPDGIYRRVEVRVSAIGFPPLDYEIDEREWDGQWVKVDSGALGHLIHDDCPGAAQ